MFFRSPARLAALAWIGLVGAAVAAPPVAVVELFTSQGCSSCPPADEILGELSKRQDVLALTFPVDYWDYLGWKDTLAHPLFTKRQRAYAHARGDRQVYTPQAIVNGTKPCIGSDRSELEAVTRSGQALPVAVSTTETNDAVEVHIDAGPDRVAHGRGLAAAGPARPDREDRPRRERRPRGDLFERRPRHDPSRRMARRPLDLRCLAPGRPRRRGRLCRLLQTLEGSKPGVILGAAKSPGL